MESRRRVGSRITCGSSCKVCFLLAVCSFSPASCESPCCGECTSRLPLCSMANEGERRNQTPAARPPPKKPSWSGREAEGLVQVQIIRVGEWPSQSRDKSRHPSPPEQDPAPPQPSNVALSQKMLRSTAMSLRKESMMTVMMAIRTMIEVGDDDNGR